MVLSPVSLAPMDGTMPATTAPLPTFTDESGVSRYLREIRRFPLLAPEEEFMLAKRWREHDDAEAAHQLVTSHLRLVAKIAMGYRGYGLPVGDLISEGNVGLMQAVKRFDPDRGFRLATYAMWWIRASMQEYILHSWSLVKMGTTAAQKKLFFNLRKLKGQIEAIDDGDLTPEQLEHIATALNVSQADVVSMNRRMIGPDQSLNTPVREEGGGEWQDWLVDPSDDQESTFLESSEFEHRRQLFHDSLGVLNAREKHILAERRLKDQPSTLEELSQEYGISRERVRQIEGRAFEKLQKAMRQALRKEREAAGAARASVGAELAGTAG
jgi:RNA polymerase sigma-32 factor